MATGLSVCCLTRGHAAERTARILRLYRSVADEIVVAVDERCEEAVPVLSSVGDRLLTFPFAEPGDRAIPWLFANCRQEWILNVDDDEVPSAALLEVLPDLVRSDNVTHCWIGRRWLHPDVRRYLGEPPWVREYQLRLVLADPRFLQFSDEFHRPVVCSGPARFVSEPLWHLDTAVNSVESRRRKALEYERSRRGMRIASFSHNTGLYLPELRPGAMTLPVPPADLALIRAVLGEGGQSNERGPTGGRPIESATRGDVDRHWPGPPWPNTIYRARLELAERPAFMVAGVQQTVDVRVENRSDRVWRWGSEGRPAIRLSYRWEGIAEEPLHTHLPCDLDSGEQAVVPVHVLPPCAGGRYMLELDLLHEHVCWFGRPLRLPVEVRPRHRIALVGNGQGLAQALDALAEQPDAEPVLLRPDGACERLTDHPELPGLERLLVGADAPVGRARILWRTARVLASPERFLPGLGDCERLIVTGADWPTDAPPSRELWRLATTLVAARRLGVEVLVTGGIAPEARGPLDRFLQFVVSRLGRTAAAGGEAPAAAANGVTRRLR